MYYLGMQPRRGLLFRFLPTEARSEKRWLLRDGRRALPERLHQVQRGRVLRLDMRRRRDLLARPLPRKPPPSRLKTSQNPFQVNLFKTNKTETAFRAKMSGRALFHNLFYPQESYDV